LAAFGAVMYPRRALPWTILAASFFVLSFGAFAPYAPWVYLNKLPVFSSMRIPSRFLMPFVLAIAILAGFGEEAIGSRGKIGYLVAALLIIGGVTDSWLVSSSNFRDILASRDTDSYSVKALIPDRRFELQPDILSKPDHNSEWRQVFPDNPYITLPLNEHDFGAVSCYEYTIFNSPVRGANQAGYRGEQYMAGDGKAMLVRWTPNILSYQVDAPTADTLVINQNFDPGWKLWKGTGWVAPFGGLLSITLPPGDQRLELVYLPWSFIAGSVITLVTCLVMIWLWRRDRAFRRHSAA